jgi:nucleotide-binding universal stress UspA family protein
MTRIIRPDGPVVDQAHHRAPPRRVLAGARIGVLDNQKPNAGVLMGFVAERLAERAGGPPPVVLTKNAAQPAPQEVIDALVREADLVLTGSAD